MPRFVNNIDLNKNQILNAVLQQLAAAPSNPVAGQMYYNTGDNKGYIYQGPSKGWTPMDSSSAETNQNAFSIVKVGSTNIEADTQTDTLTIAAGTNINISANASTDTVTIGITGQIPVANGGTGANTATQARENLGVPAKEGTSSVSFAVGMVEGTAPLDLIVDGDGLLALKHYQMTSYASFKAKDVYSTGLGSTAGKPLVTGADGKIVTGSFGASAGTFCEGNDSRLSNARTPTSHTHGSITNDGKIGADSGKPLITTTGGVIAAGSFGTAAGTFCEGNDSRLSNARTPTSHTHGSITNDGKIGVDSGKPLITTTGGVIAAGSFGTAAGTFCEGNDSRLSNARTPTSHVHGSITNDGKIGSTADQFILTGAGGTLTALPAATAIVKLGAASKTGADSQYFNIGQDIAGGEAVRLENESNTPGLLAIKLSSGDTSYGSIKAASATFTGTVTANAFSGSLSGNASTATKLATARTLTIGSSGKSFDGSANVSWSLADIGAAASGHTHATLHAQNTDTGTSNQSFTLHTSGNSSVMLKGESLGVLAIRNALDNDYGDLKVKNLIVEGTTTTINSTVVEVGDNTVLLNTGITSSTQNRDGGISIKRFSTGTVRADAELLFSESQGRFTSSVKQTNGTVVQHGVVNKYSADIPATAAGSVANIIHGLNTSDVIVGVYEASTGDVVYPDVTISADTNVHIRFSKAVTAGEYKVVIMG